MKTFILFLFLICVSASAEEPKKQFSAEEFWIHINKKQGTKQPDIDIDINAKIGGKLKNCKVICK